MKLEGTGNLGFSCGQDLNLRFKLRATTFAHRQRGRLESDPSESALQHVPSLPPFVIPVNFKRHHYQKVRLLAF
jgi:hypothetical protein